MSKGSFAGPALVLMLVASVRAAPTAAASLDVPEDYATIAAALAAASYGDTVSIAAGTYCEHDLEAAGRWPRSRP